VPTPWSTSASSSVTEGRSSRRWSRSDPDLPGWAELHRQVRQSSRTWSDDPDLRAEVDGSGSDEANKAVSKAEDAIPQVRHSPHPVDRVGGQLTPSLKLKRNLVMRESHDDVEALQPLTRPRRSHLSGHSDTFRGHFGPCVGISGTQVPLASVFPR
jgi:hypothetical protein